MTYKYYKCLRCNRKINYDYVIENYNEKNNINGHLVCDRCLKTIIKNKKW